MRFNGFEKQLKRWGRESPPEPNKPKPKAALAPKPPRSSRERIVGGDIKWKPVDRAAAMLFAKAHWLSVPQPTVTQKDDPKMSEHITKRNMTDIPGTPTATVIHDKTEREFRNTIVQKSTREIEKTVAQEEEIVKRAEAAREAMETLVSTYKAAWMDFSDDSAKRLLELRQYRVATETEIRTLMTQLRDVRTFFLAKDYEQERERLREFVDLCERLQKLKESGFLDMVADTLLRLAV